MVTVLSAHVHESGVHVDEAGPVSFLVGAVLNKAPEEGLKGFSKVCAPCKNKTDNVPLLIIILRITNYF